MHVTCYLPEYYKCFEYSGGKVEIISYKIIINNDQ